MGHRPPEKPTAIERLVGLVPVSYPVAALIWSILFGSPGFYLVEFLDTGTTSFSTSLGTITSSVLYTVVPFYLFFVGRYMRLRVVAADRLISPRLSKGEEDYHEAFGNMTRTAPVLALAVPLWFLTFPVSNTRPAVSVFFAFNVVALTLPSVGFATYAWVYANTCLGLHRLGGSSLQLSPYLEDRMMGTGPLGNLALSLTVAYFGGLLLLALLFFGSANTSFQVMLVAFLLLGVLMFFLPLNKIHEKMLTEKRQHQREIAARYLQMSRGAGESSKREVASLDDVHSALGKLTGLQELEMLDKKVASIPTWPFDVQVVSKFVTIVLSVTAVLLSRLITGFLRI